MDPASIAMASRRQTGEPTQIFLAERMTRSISTSRAMAQVLTGGSAANLPAGAAGNPDIAARISLRPPPRRPPNLRRIALDLGKGRQAGFAAEMLILARAVARANRKCSSQSLAGLAR